MSPNPHVEHVRLLVIGDTPRVIFPFLHGAIAYFLKTRVGVIPEHLCSRVGSSKYFSILTWNQLPDKFLFFQSKT